MPLYTTMRGACKARGGGQEREEKKKGRGARRKKSAGIDKHHAGQIKEARRGRDGGLAQNQAKRKV